MLALAAVAVVLLWLNGSPWWGWMLVIALLLAVGWVARKWLRSTALLQVGAWVIATALVANNRGSRLSAAAEPRCGRARPDGDVALETQQGPVTGVYDDERSVESFAGIPYAKPPAGALRWAAPQPPEKHTEVLAADRFSDAPIQTTSSFLIRALSRIIALPLKNTFLNP